MEFFVPGLFVNMSSTAQMDDATRAMCYALRHPGRGHKPMKYADIRKVVKKTDRSRPSVQAIAQAVAAYPLDKKVRGRKKGWSKTSRDEVILNVDHDQRVHGDGVGGQLHAPPLRKLARVALALAREAAVASDLLLDVIPAGAINAVYIKAP